MSCVSQALAEHVRSSALPYTVRDCAKAGLLQREKQAVLLPRAKAKPQNQVLPAQQAGSALEGLQGSAGQAQQPWAGKEARCCTRCGHKVAMPGGPEVRGVPAHARLITCTISLEKHACLVSRVQRACRKLSRDTSKHSSPHMSAAVQAWQVHRPCVMLADSRPGGAHRRQGQ